MSGMKVSGEVTKNKAIFNTTIDADVFEEFKRSCKASGIKMNTLVEAFMRQYVMGEYYLRLGSKNGLELHFTGDNK